MAWVLSREAFSQFHGFQGVSIHMGLVAGHLRFQAQGLERAASELACDCS